MRRVLVFGASGFIGSQVCVSLRENPRVSAVITPGRRQYDLVNGDVPNLVALLRSEWPDTIVNCTGLLGGLGHELVQANTVVTAKLIDAIGQVAPGIRLVRLGSAGEYGVVAHGRAVTEDDPAVPVSPYGVSHLAATSLVRIASAAGQVDGVVLRVFNPIGPGLHQENLLGRAVKQIQQAMRDGAGHICMGPLSAWRDFVDVRDLAAAVSAAALKPALDHRVYNVASGSAVPARTAMELLAATAGFAGEIREEAPAPSRSAAVDWMRGDISRASAELRWTPTYDLGESVKAIWAGAATP